MTKEELALTIVERLKKEYPDVGCTLDYDKAWKLLVSVRLAAQCTDARVNVVVQDLYAKYPDVDALAAAEVSDIEAIVKPCGLGHSKARDISACMKILRDEYGGKVPDDFDALLKLPGVGRHPPGEPHGACGRDQGAEKGGDGSLEVNSAGRGERFLPQAGVPWPGCLYGADKALR